MAAERDKDTSERTTLISDFSELAGRGRTSDIVPKGLRPQSGYSMPPPSSTEPVALEAAMLASLQECFTELAGPDSRIDEGDLQRSLAVKSLFLAERVLAVFDRNRDGGITRVEFLHGAPRLLFGSMRDKLRFAFRLHDLDGDGVIERDEIIHMLELGLAEDGTATNPALVERFAEVLLGAADTNRDGRVSFSEFEALALHHSDVTLPLARAEESWVATGKDLLTPDAVIRSRAARVVRFLDDNATRIAVVSLWVIANGALFVHAWLKYQALGASQPVILARGAGACLNFNGALVLVPMARRLVTWIRRTPLARVLPVDAGVAFHRLLGNTLFALSLVHAGAHLVNYARSPRGTSALLLGTKAGQSGLALLLVFGVLWLFSQRVVRASGHFELFHRTHLLYPLWFALALVHGPVFWQWALVPLGVFLGDKLLGWPRKAATARVSACVPLASGVTKLSIEKPAGFAHTAGDYVYLRLPVLARHEWHPFTISSAPEQPLLTLHVRSLGDFTSALYRLAEQRAQKAAAPPLVAHLDGPFGTPSAKIFEAKRAVLIGAGIGVTPFASVLESIVLRDQAGDGALEKVHFYWLNRDAVSFEWFVALLADLDRRDTRRLVDVRIFMTGGRGDSTALLLNLARDVAHSLGDPDCFTGLRAKTEMGAPDWHRELTRAAGADPEEVDVFFCGPPGLRRTVERLCSDLGLRFHAEQF